MPSSALSWMCALRRRAKTGGPLSFFTVQYAVAVDFGEKVVEVGKAGWGGSGRGDGRHMQVRAERLTKPPINGADSLRKTGLVEAVRIRVRKAVVQRQSQCESGTFS
jgi:hypothetical protein